MSLYPTKQTPIPQAKPPHMPTLPHLQTHSTGLVGTTPGPECPKSRHKRESLHFSLVPSTVSSQHSQETPQLEDLLADTQDIHATEIPFFNQPCHVLPQSPLAPIWEQLHIMGFTPMSSSTPYGQQMWDPPLESQLTSPSRAGPSTFMTPLT